MDLDDMMLELRSGKIEALGEIYEQTKAAVYAVAFAVLRQKEAAEDVMQNTYLNLVRKIDKYKPNGKAKAWICKTAKNLALNYARDNRRTLPPDEAVTGMPAADVGGCRDIIDAAAEVLTADETELVLMHALGGFSHLEIAEFFGIPYATARWRYGNALVKLRNKMEKEETES